MTKEELKLFRSLLNELIDLNDEAGGVEDIRINIKRVNAMWRKKYATNAFIEELFKRLPSYGDYFKMSEFIVVN